MKLETERLILRRPEAADTDDYLAFRNSEFVLRYNAMAPKSREQTAEQFAKGVGNMLVLQLKETGRVIGAVCIDEDSLRWQASSREISYFLAEDHARQGYMKEALTAVIGRLFACGTECVTARCFAPNTASRRLLCSLGFSQEGLLRRCVRGYGGILYDDAVYSLLKEEFIR